MRPKVVIAVNVAWNLHNFRAGLIAALVREGYEVVAVASEDAYAARLADLGCRFVPLAIDHQGTHPARDALLLARFWRILRRERPAVYLGYTVKPNIYGSLAARLLGIPVVNNIAGLGTVFIRRTWLTTLVRLLYRLALAKSAKIFFQNEDDRRLFIEGGLARPEATDRLPGSGVDLARFAPAPPPSHSRGEPLRFLLAARLLWDKGVGEYVEAARRVRRGHPGVEFCLLGFLDVQNPSAIPRARVEEWEAEGVVAYLGDADDVRPHLARADCVVLPSYREGLPRVLLEAAAMGRPLIATDAPGCREVVDDGVNGYLCSPRDAHDLAEKMERMIALSPGERAAMGLRGREKAQREFDERFVIRSYLDALRSLAPPGA